MSVESVSPHRALYSSAIFRNMQSEEKVNFIKSHLIVQNASNYPHSLEVGIQLPERKDGNGSLLKLVLGSTQRLQ